MKKVLERCVAMERPFLMELEWCFKELIREIFKEGFVRFGAIEKIAILKKKMARIHEEDELDHNRQMVYLIYCTHQEENNPGSLEIRARRVSLLHACGLGDFIPHQLQD